LAGQAEGDVPDAEGVQPRRGHATGPVRPGR
jgi:hypothetical protein